MFLHCECIRFIWRITEDRIYQSDVVVFSIKDYSKAKTWLLVLGEKRN